MMITLRKLPLAVAVAAGVMSAQALVPLISTATLVLVSAGPAAAVSNSASKPRVLKANTVLATNVKPMRN